MCGSLCEDPTCSKDLLVLDIEKCQNVAMLCLFNPTMDRTLAELKCQTITGEEITYPMDSLDHQKVSRTV